MTIAPERQLAACLKVLEYAILQARHLHGGCSPGDASISDQVFDLLDAVHNIPSLLLRWDHADLDRLRADLQDYDECWGAQSVFCLLETYEKALSGD